MAFHTGAVWARIRCRLLMASRYSASAFFSEATAERWSSSRTFCTVRSPALGMLAMASTASGQPGASGGVRADSLRSSSTFRTLSSRRLWSPGYSFELGREGGGDARELALEARLRLGAPGLEQHLAVAPP